MIAFKINASKGFAVPLPIGRVPGGYRLQITYDSRVTFSGTSDSGVAKTVEKFEGKVLAGSDWLLLRDDGVAVFDTNITFEADKPRTHVFDGKLSGQASLKDVGWIHAIGSPKDWQDLKGTLAVTLPIRFETSVDPSPQAAKEIRKAAANGGPFAELAIHQYLAHGTFVIANGTIVDATLDVRSASDAMDRSRAAKNGTNVQPQSMASGNAYADPIVYFVSKATRHNWEIVCHLLKHEDAIGVIVEKLRQSGAPEEDISSLRQLPRKQWNAAEEFLVRVRNMLLDWSAAANTKGTGTD